jgi:hypothetical protein
MLHSRRIFNSLTGVATTSSTGKLKKITELDENERAVREAVILLETTYTLSYTCPITPLATNQPAEKNVVNLSSDKGKGWWSQRDLNPCLSLERAPS